MAEQEKKAKKIRYQNRKTSILKKSKELSTLCDVKLCVVIVSPDGKLETWPDNLNDVKAVLSAVKESGKSIRSENPREKKGSGGDRLCSRIKIPKSDKGKEIDVENCGFGNNAAGVVEDEVLYDVSGADQEHNTAQMDNDFGMSVVDMGVINQAPTFSSSYYGNGNGESNCEGFGNFIGDMVTNQGESNLGYYGCGSYHHQQNESGSSSSFAMNPKPHFSNLQPNQEPCGPDHFYGRRYDDEMGSSTGFNFSYQDPSSSIAYHQEQHDSTGVNNNFCNMVQPISSLPYEQYEFGIWEWQQ